MNISLYQEIISKLNLLDPEEKKTEKISVLIGQWSNRKNPIDVISVLCAFYNYLDGKAEYSFIHRSNWHDFFGSRFTNYFNIEIVKNLFDNIIFDDKMTDLVLKFARDEVKKEFYEYAKLQNDFSLKFNNIKYKYVFEKLETKCIDLGIIEKKTEKNTSNGTLENVYRTASVIKNENSEIEQQIELLQARKKANEHKIEENRENIFSSTADDIGIKKDSLIKKVGKEESYEVDKINVSDEFKDFITNLDSKVASVPNGMYKKILQKISSRKKLKMAELDISVENGMTTLTLSKKDTIFDKIASTSGEMLKKIKDSAEEKLVLSLMLGVGGAILMKDAIVNTNTKIKNKANNTKSAIKRDINDFSKKIEKVAYDAVLGVGTAQMAAGDLIDDAKEKIDIAKQSAATNAANKLRNFADRIEPSHDIANQVETVVNPAETTITEIQIPNTPLLLAAAEMKKISSIPGIEFEYMELNQEIPNLRRLVVNPGDSMQLVAKKLKTCKDEGISAYAVFKDLAINNFEIDSEKDVIEQIESKFATIQQNFINGKNVNSLSNEEKNRLYDIKKRRIKGQYINPEELEFENLCVGKYEEGYDVFSQQLVVLDSYNNMLKKQAVAARSQGGK